MNDLEKQGKSGSVDIKSVEDIGSPTLPALIADRYHFDEHDLDRVQRRLKQRHVQMIAIAGVLGSGLFLGSGNALRTAGPVGALAAYVLMGTVTYASLCALGELTTWAPISGTFPHFAARYVDPALGFALGWNYFYGIAILVPIEVIACTILLTFWDENPDHSAIYIAVIAFAMCSINIFGVRWFGESEFGFAIVKLSTITGLLIAGLVVDLGGGPNHERIGFRHWKDPGALNRAGLVSNLHTDRFLAMLSVLVQAAFSFQGMELVAIAASETESPRRNIRKAVSRVFYRIVVFYVLAIFMIGLLVAYDDPALLQATGNAAQSPFVIAFNRAGIRGLPHVINAAVFTSALSAGNSLLFCGSRILYGLSIRGQAPRFLTYTTKNGLPLTAVIFTSCFSLLAFMSVNSSASKVFGWFVSLTTTTGFTTWLCINLTYVFFHRGMIAQGFDLKSNVYNNSWQPWISYWGIFWTSFFILTNGYAVFFHFNVSNFLVAYINIPIFAALYVGYKFAKGTRIWKPKEIDLVTGIPSVEETELPEIPPTTFWGKFSAIIF